jgi:hypothetical protein
VADALRGGNPRPLNRSVLVATSLEATVSSYPARLVGEHVPKNADRLEVRSTTRRHRALVRGTDAAVVLGVLGYTTAEPSSRVDAAEFISRARAWLAQHDPHAVRDPDAASPISWTPDPTSAQAYHRSPTAYRGTFSSFTFTSRAPGTDDWISWRPR